MKDLIFFFFKLPNYLRLRLILLQIAIIFTNFTEIVSIALISPYIGILANNEIIFENKILFYLYNLINFENVSSFIVFLGFVILAAIILANTFMGIVIYAGKKITNSLGNFLILKIFEYYIYLDYESYLKEDNKFSSINNNLVIEVNRFTQQALQPFIEINKRVFVVLFMIALLLFFQPIITLVIGFFVIVSVATIKIISHKKLGELGKTVTNKNKKKIKIINETFSSIREVKFLSLENKLTREFHKNNINLYNAEAIIYLFANLPKNFLEVIASTIMILFLVTLYQLNTNFNELIVLMSLIAIAAYKILPALHTILFNLSAFNGNIESYYQIKNQIDLVLDNKIITRKPNENISNQIDDFKKISISNISFKFPRNSLYIFKNLSLNFHIGKRYFVTGASGSGKSTLIDILSGILYPSRGEIFINERLIEKDEIKILQNLISYVPQNINFFDRSLIENITLNFVENKKIDYDLIKKIIEITDLESFVASLPEGLDTNLGEKLEQLSGGQRQRVSIARALYRKKPILILDEATSALDFNTEKNIFDKVNKLDYIKLIICSTHRKSMIKKEDILINIDNGKIEIVS